LQVRSFPIDTVLGLDPGYTDGLKRLVGRGVGFWSYRLAAENLEEFFGIHLSHTTVGDFAQGTANKIAVTLPDRLDLRKDFQEAKGDVEFFVDGTCINTRDAENQAPWQEVKVGVIGKRSGGESATPSQWTSRNLPQPTMVSSFAAIESKEEFQKRCQSEARRLGVSEVSSALCDGAAWV